MSIKILSVAEGLAKRNVSADDSKKIKINTKQLGTLEERNSRLPASRPYNIEKMPTPSTPKSLLREELNKKKDQISIAYNDQKEDEFKHITMSKENAKKQNIEDIPSIKNKKSCDSNTILRKIGTIEKLAKDAKPRSNVKKLLDAACEVLSVLKGKIEELNTIKKDLIKSVQTNEDLKNQKIKEAKTIESRFDVLNQMNYDRLSQLSSNEKEKCIQEANNYLSIVQDTYNNISQIINSLYSDAKKYSDAKEENLGAIERINKEIEQKYEKMNAVCDTVDEKFDTAKSADAAEVKAEEILKEKARQEEAAKNEKEQLQATLNYDISVIMDKAGISSEKEAPSTSTSLFDILRQGEHSEKEVNNTSSNSTYDEEPINFNQYINQGNSRIAGETYFFPSDSKGRAA